MEKIIENINNALSRFQPEPIRDDDADKSWKLSNDVDQHTSNGSSSSSVLWDHLKPYPIEIAANKMW